MSQGFAPIAPRSPVLDATSGRMLGSDEAVSSATFKNSEKIRIQYPNGSIYTGSIREGKRHGFGRLDIPSSGESYEGEWLDGLRHGNGVYYYSDGSRYSGEWNRGEKTGFGRIEYKHGDTYEGLWRNGRQTGHGAYRFARGDVFIGEFVDGQQHGFGAHLGSDGTMYAGDWFNGRRQGVGVKLSETGLFEGEFRAHSAVKGVLTLPNGTRSLQELNGDAVIRAQTLDRDGGATHEAMERFRAAAEAALASIRALHEQHSSLGDVQLTTRLDELTGSTTVRSEADADGDTLPRIKSVGDLPRSPTAPHRDIVAASASVTDTFGTLSRTLSRSVVAPSAAPAVPSSTGAVSTVLKYALAIMQANDWLITTLRERSARLAALKHMEGVQGNADQLSKHLSAVEGKYTAALEEIKALRNRPVEHFALESDAKSNERIKELETALNELLNVEGLNTGPASPTRAESAPMQIDATVDPDVARAFASVERKIAAGQFRSGSIVNATGIGLDALVARALHARRAQKLNTEESERKCQDQVLLVQNYEKQVNDLMTQLRSALESNTKLRATVEELKLRPDPSVLAELTTARQDLKSTRQSLTLSQDKTRSLEIELQTCRAEVLVVEAKLRELTERERENEAAREAKFALMTSQAALAGAKAEAATALSELENRMRATLEEHSRRLQAEQARHDEAMREEQKRKQAELAAAQARADTQKEALMVSHRTAQIALTKDLDACRSELEQARTRIAIMQATAERLRDERAKAEASIEAKHAAVEAELQMALQRSEERRVHEAADHSRALQVTMSHVQGSRQPTETSPSRSTHDVNAAHDDIRAMATVMAKDRARLQDLQLERDQAFGLRDALHHELSAAKTEREELHNSLRIERDLRAVLETDLVEMRGQLAALQSQLSAAQSRTIETGLAGVLLSSPQPSHGSPKVSRLADGDNSFSSGGDGLLSGSLNSTQLDLFSRRTAYVRTIAGLYDQLARGQVEQALECVSESLCAAVHANDAVFESIIGEYQGRAGMRQYLERRRRAVSVSSVGEAYRIADGRGVVVVRQFSTKNQSEVEQAWMEVDIWKFVDAQISRLECLIVRCASKV